MHRRIKNEIFMSLFRAKAFELVLLTEAYLIYLEGQPRKFVELHYISNITFSLPYSYSTVQDNNFTFKKDSLTS